MNKDNVPFGAKKTKSSVKCDSVGNVIDFGGWETEEAKLRHNLTLMPEQILDWLEDVNSHNKKIRENAYVL